MPPLTPPDPTTSSVTVWVQPDPAYVSVARGIVGSVARLHGFDEPAVDDIRLATSEICGRAVAAHCDHDSNKRVRVEIGVRGRWFVVEIEDSEPAGPGAATLRMRAEEMLLPAGVQPNVPEAIGFAGGLADELDVRVSESGFAVTMRWRMSGVTAPG